MTQDWSERCTRWTGVRSDWIDVDGTRVHVLRADGAETGGRRPQLLLHGLGGSAANWLDVIPGLTAHGPVVAPDLPGFGATEPAGERSSSVEQQVAFLTRLLDRLGWGQAVVHGNSMGGTLALMLAGAAPERVAWIVLAAPALPAPLSRVHRTAPGTLLRFAPFTVPGLGRLAMQLCNRLPVDRYARQVARYVHADPERVSPEALEVGVEDLLFGRDLPWRLSGFVVAARSLVHALLSPRGLREHIDGAEAPVLVIWGDTDRLVGRPVIDHLAERRPDWELTVLEATGHVPMLEAPGRYVEALASWLRMPSGRVERPADRTAA
jgi:pimeloyl-ACP methyl ester carboxylesterase